jgi:hypothetical protein
VDFHELAFANLNDDPFADRDRGIRIADPYSVDADASLVDQPPRLAV